jgi:hypothetical protein
LPYPCATLDAFPAPTNAYQAPSETVDVQVTVDAVERCVGSGSLVAQAVVAIDVAGIPLELFGVQIRRDGQRLGVLMPQFKHWRRGIWMPSVRWKLHPQIHQTITDELISVFTNMPADSSFYIGETLAAAAREAGVIQDMPA